MQVTIAFEPDPAILDGNRLLPDEEKTLRLFIGTYTTAYAAQVADRGASAVVIFVTPDDDDLAPVAPEMPFGLPDGSTLGAVK